MGRETCKEEYPCGCIFEYSFDECCGMGAIPGTEKRQMIWCDTHRPEVQRLENTIVRAKRELNSIRYNIRAKKKQPKIDEEEALPPEFGEPGFDMAAFTAKAREWCTTILIPALDAARLEGKTFLEIPDDKVVFEPTCCEDILETWGITSENFSWNNKTRTMKFSF